MPQANLFGTNSKLIQQLKVLDKPEPGIHITAISEGSSVENTPEASNRIDPLELDTDYMQQY
tara:strand:+ start:22 stop:207 length:186 start_codon:yes stop_codon:yes gene_type:complete